ncbi:MAG: tetratricopeptide repeat protein [Bacteroidales bacterium]|nr:tetratricopeptide repeat protein [Bacteroidales bacterium]
MKRITLVLIAALFAGIAGAQTVKLQSAINYLDDLRLIEAKKAINEAAEHEKTKNDPKTWLYKGKIYRTIYQISTMDDAIELGMKREMVEKVLGKPYKDRRNWSEYRPDMRIEFEDGKVSEFSKPADGAYENIAEEPLMTAYDSYQKAIELDKEENYLQAVKLELMNLGNLTYNAAVQAYNSKSFEIAENYFMKTVNIKKTFGELDTNSIFNAAISAFNSEDYEKALEHYLNLVEFGYSNPKIYSTASQILISKKDTAKAEKILKLGRERHPDSYDVLINLTNIYLTRGDIEKSTELLNLALEKQPDNEQLYYNVGVVYDQSAKDTTLSKAKREEVFDQAVKNYKKAIELNNEYFDAYYNLGALFFNNGVSLLKQADSLPLEAEEKYNALKNKAEEEFKNALPYLEKAYELKPNDQNTLVALKELYTRTKKYEKLKKINAKLKKEENSKEE